MSFEHHSYTVHADSGMLLDVMFVLLSVCLHYSYYRVTNAMTTNMESSTDSLETVLAV